MRQTYKKILTAYTPLVFIGCFLMFFFPFFADASVNLEVGIGTSFEAENLSDYLSQAYTFITGSIGIISAVMIMFNGFNWAIAMGNAEEVGKAKSGITSAIIGLVLALISYTLLQILNPALVENTEPTLGKVTIVPLEVANAQCSQQFGSGGAGDASCVLFYANSPYIRTYENAGVIAFGSESAARDFEQMAEAYYTKFGTKLVVGHTFRSVQYQQCLVDRNQGQSAAAACNSPHNRGMAVDLGIRDMFKQHGQDALNWLACGTTTTCGHSPATSYSGRPVLQTHGNTYRFFPLNYNPNYDPTADVDSDALWENHHFDYRGPGSGVAMCSVCPTSEECDCVFSDPFENQVRR